MLKRLFSASLGMAAVVAFSAGTANPTQDAQSLSPEPDIEPRAELRRCGVTAVPTCIVFSRGETEFIATAGSSVGGAAEKLCASFPGPSRILCTFLVNRGTADLVSTAEQAQAQGQCLGIAPLNATPLPPGGPYPEGPYITSC